jgi:ribonuclease Y
METYLNRLQDMEKVVSGFAGIESAYIMQAGNEVRALVTPEEVSDTDVQELANDVAYKLRQEMTFPGQVKVTIVRERQTVELAK